MLLGDPLRIIMSASHVLGTMLNAVRATKIQIFFFFWQILNFNSLQIIRFVSLLAFICEC